MNSIAVLLLGFDHALSHDWESLAGTIANLTDAESGWQHPAYRAEPHDNGIGKPGTVLWFLNHLEHCHRHYTEVLRAAHARQQETGSAINTRPPGELPLSQIIPALAAANAALRAEIEALPDTELQAHLPSGKTKADFVLAAIRHIAWHAGQIATIRRLRANERGRGQVPAPGVDASS